MRITDFQYDGINLKDMGFMCCTFGKDGSSSVKSGSQLNFSTVSTQHGNKQEFIAANYTDCLQATFTICKDWCESGSFEISQTEIFDMTGWLARKGFKKLKFMDEEDELDLFVEASFNVTLLESYGMVYGLQLDMVTNRPFALMEEKYVELEAYRPGQTVQFYDPSNEEGYIYPKTKITINETCDLTLLNRLENRATIIRGCIEGEEITMEYPVIQSNVSTHNLQNDFNWNFLRVANTFSNKKNEITASNPCKIELSYNPIAKLGI